MIDSQTLAFTGVALLLTITPGADTMLVMRSVFAHGERAGLLTTLGITSGLLVHALLSGIGLSVLLVQSATAFQVVKLVGAFYLIYLGLASLWRARSHSHESASDDTLAGARRGQPLWRAYRDGMVTNVLNPKVAVFYLAFLPQFIGPGDDVLGKSVLLAGIHGAMGIVWLSLVTTFLGKLRGLLADGRVQNWLEGVSGAVLVGLGLRLALERK